ncbi:hypothetical protein [Hymenobacter psoromatis]|nr:hypothetical protein [Hymenobacter psoromatis]
MAEAAPAPTPTTGFARLFTRWISEHSRRPRTNSSQPLSKLAVAGLVAT